MTPLPLIQPMPWMEHAACNPDNADVFFPTAGNNYEGKSKEAREVCDTCPVIDACLQHALALDPVDGIWGGLTPNQRKNLRRKARR